MRHWFNLNLHIHLWIYTLYLQQVPIYDHDGASAKFSPNLQETDYSVYRKFRIFA